MKLNVLLSMLFDLLERRKVTASYFSHKFDLSPRTIYRYVDVLSKCVPVEIKRGRDGGIFVSDCYKLSAEFMTKEEYSACIEALDGAYSQSLDARFIQAKRKLSAKQKKEFTKTPVTGDNGTILFDSLSSQVQTNKIRLLEECIRERISVDVVYENPKQGKISVKIEPHLLICKRQIWFIYAFCPSQRTFLLLPIGHILTLLKTQTKFRKRPFSRADVVPTLQENAVMVRLACDEDVLPDVKLFFGVNCLQRENGVWIATVTLPDDENLLSTLLRFGAKTEVLSPAHIRERISTVVQHLSQIYTQQS